MANPIKASDIAEKNVARNLVDGFKEAIKEGKNLLKGLIAIGKQEQKNIDIIKKRPDTIKKTKELDKAIKKSDKTVKSINKTRTASIKIAKQLEAAQIKRIAARSKEAKQIEVNNRLSREQNAINKEQAILNNKTAGTLEKLAVKNKQLIRIRKGLNLETKKGRDRLKAINVELDKNNKIIKKNSSALEKQKINIGNYGSSLKEAAGASGLFGGVLGKLAAVQGVINALTKTAVVVEEADIVAKTGQAVATTNLTIAQRAANIATSVGTKALKLLKVAMAATGIGAVVIILGSLFALFTRNQDAVDGLSDSMAGITAAFDVLIDRMTIVGRGIVQVFKGLGSELKKVQIRLKIFLLELAQFDAFGTTVNDNTKAVAELNKELEGLVGIEEGLETIASAFRGIGDEIIRDTAAATKLNELTRDATRLAKLFEAEQATGLRRAKELEIISRNKLNSDEERVAALRKASAIQEAISDRQVAIQTKLLASALDGLTADGQSLVLSGKRLDFVNKIKNGQIGAAEAVKLAADFTLSSAAGEEALFEIIERITEQENARATLAQLRATLVKKESALLVQIATKNATALTREAAALRQQATERERTIEDRIRLISEAAELEIESFEVQVVANIKNARELAAAKLQIESKLQQDIAKLRAVAVNTQAIAAEKRRLKAIEELRQEDIEGQIEELERRLENEEDLEIAAQIEIINEIAELRKQALIQADEFARARFDEALAVRLKAIEENDKLTLEQRVEATKKEEEAVAKERELAAERLANDLEDIEQGKVDAVKDANDQILENDKETNDKRRAEAEKLAKAVAREFTNLIKERNKENIALIDAEIKRAQTAVDRQTEIAEKGQINILGKEQARLDKANLEKRREAERAAKQEQNIALATAFLNNLAARSKTNPDTAFALAVRDTIGARLFAEALSSFYEGTEDTGTTSNPLDNKGGRTVIVHDNERIMTGSQNDRVGNMSNEKLADLAYDYQHGNLQLSPSHFKQIEVGNMMKSDNSMSGVESILQAQTNRLEKAFADGQTDIRIHWNEHGDAVEIREKKRIRKITTFKRPRLG